MKKRASFDTHELVFSFNNIKSYKNYINIKMYVLRKTSWLIFSRWSKNNVILRCIKVSQLLCSSCITILLLFSGKQQSCAMEQKRRNDMHSFDIPEICANSIRLCLITGCISCGATNCAYPYCLVIFSVILPLLSPFFSAHFLLLASYHAENGRFECQWWSNGSGWRFC